MSVSRLHMHEPKERREKGTINSRNYPWTDEVRVTAVNSVVSWHSLAVTWMDEGGSRNVTEGGERRADDDKDSYYRY